MCGYAQTLGGAAEPSVDSALYALLRDRLGEYRRPARYILLGLCCLPVQFNFRVRLSAAAKKSHRVASQPVVSRG